MRRVEWDESRCGEGRLAEGRGDVEVEVHHVISLTHWALLGRIVSVRLDY